MSLLKYLVAGAWVIFMISCGGSSQQVAGSGDLSEAEIVSSERIASLKENIEDEPNNLSWRLELAREYESLGYNMEAIKTYEGALAIDPNRSDLKYNYAELAEQMGEKRKSYQAYKDILLGMEGPQYLNRIAPKFIDSYNVVPIISSPASEAFGAYSSDGTKIIYQAHNGTNWDIFEYQIASQSTKQLTFDNSHEENPVYSPDGNYIAYTSTKDDHRNVDYNQKLRDIYTLDLGTGLETNLTTNSSNDWRPRYSRNGDFIVFVSERSDLRNVSIDELYSHIFLMEDNGSFQLELTKIEANDGGPVLLGGETGTVYFDSNRNGTYDIYRIKTDGTDLKQITYGRDYNNVAPDLNSDGTKIAFFSDRDNNYELYTMSVDGENEIRITSNPADDLNPVFSPDGRKILFHSNRSGNYDLYEVDLEQKNSGATISDVVARIDAAMSTM
jgi:Tol biopolymer transport system component